MKASKGWGECRTYQGCPPIFTQTTSATSWRTGMFFSRSCSSSASCSTDWRSLLALVAGASSPKWTSRWRENVSRCNVSYVWAEFDVDACWRGTSRRVRPFSTNAYVWKICPFLLGRALLQMCPFSTRPQRDEHLHSVLLLLLTRWAAQHSFSNSSSTERDRHDWLVDNVNTNKQSVKDVRPILSIDIVWRCIDVSACFGKVEVVAKCSIRSARWKCQRCSTMYCFLLVLYSLYLWSEKNDDRRIWWRTESSSSSAICQSEGGRRNPQVTVSLSLFAVDLNVLLWDPLDMPDISINCAIVKATPTRKRRIVSRKNFLRFSNVRDRTFLSPSTPVDRIRTKRASSPMEWFLAMPVSPSDLSIRDKNILSGYIPQRKFQHGHRYRVETDACSVSTRSSFEDRQHQSRSLRETISSYPKTPSLNSGTVVKHFLDYHRANYPTASSQQGRDRRRTNRVGWANVSA